MAPKRKTRDDNNEVEIEEETSNKKAKKNNKKISGATSSGEKTPKTLKDKILHLLAKQEKLIGLASIKKILKDDYDIDDSKTNATRINKTLKDLEAENHVEFGRIDRSYHGGLESAAYLAYQEEIEAKQAEIAEDDRPVEAGELKCPYCSAINHEDDGTVNSDSTSGGMHFECIRCGDWFSPYECEGYTGNY
jgi:DNA-directed RNA polymerase subunit RPC12/RpoP